MPLTPNNKKYSANAKIKARKEWIKNKIKKQSKNMGKIKKQADKAPTVGKGGVYHPIGRPKPNGVGKNTVGPKRPSSGKLKRPKYGPGKVTPRGR